MTIEEKAKAYDEALEQAKFYHGNCPNEPERKKLEKMFPELRESEDKRIRKEIIDFIQWAEDRGMTRHDYHQEKRPAVWIAYLEKQKEQKPVDYDHEMWKNCEANFEGGKKEVIEHPEKYGLHKEQKPTISDEAIREGIVHFGITQYQIDNWLKKHINIVEQKEQKHDGKKWIYEDDYHKDMERAFNDGKDEVLKNPEKYGLQKEQPADYCSVRDEFDLDGNLKQKPTEWSEEDEDAIQQAILALEDRYDEYEPNLCFLGYKLPFNKAAERLKSLRPSWKPSEEQMEQLRSAAVLPEFGPMVTARKQFPDLESLYNDLKKLI